MKKIDAFIRHEAFEPIRPGSSLTVSVRPKLRLEVVVADGDTRTVAGTIIRPARSQEEIAAGAGSDQ